MYPFLNLCLCLWVNSISFPVRINYPLFSACSLIEAEICGVGGKKALFCCVYGAGNEFVYGVDYVVEKGLEELLVVSRKIGKVSYQRGVSEMLC